MSATVLVESPHRSHIGTRVLATAASLAVVVGATVFAVTTIDDSNATTPERPPAATSHRGHAHEIGRGSTTPGALDQQLTLHDARR
jgi:hypothetical protein